MCASLVSPSAYSIFDVSNWTFIFYWTFPIWLNIYFLSPFHCSKQMQRDFHLKSKALDCFQIKLNSTALDVGCYPNKLYTFNSHNGVIIWLFGCYLCASQSTDFTIVAYVKLILEHLSSEELYLDEKRKEKMITDNDCLPLVIPTN